VDVAGNAETPQSVSVTITKGTPSGSVGPDNIVYDTALAGSQLGTSLGGVAGTFSFGSLEGTRLNAGSYTETYTFTPADTADYNSVTGSVTVNVAQATLQVTVDSSLMLVGTQLPTLKGSYAGTIPGVSVTYSTTATASSPVGMYPITATLSGPAAGNYALSAVPGTLYVVSVGADTDASGGQNVAFWDNKGNQVYVAGLTNVWASLDKLNLVNQDGTAFDPTNATDLDAWLQKANAKNAAYWLSAQLAATDLDVLSGKVKGTDVVSAANLLAYSGAYNLGSQYGLTSDGFITVANLMRAANDALGNYLANPAANSPYGGSPYRDYMLALAQSLQAVTNNTSFVQLSAQTVTVLDYLFANGLMS
jgi:hypothetical protein